MASAYEWLKRKIITFNFKVYILSLNSNIREHYRWGIILLKLRVLCLIYYSFLCKTIQQMWNNGFQLDIIGG